MSDFKLNLPTAQNLHKSISGDFKGSFEKKAMDAGPSIGSGAFEKQAAQSRVQFKKAQEQLRKAVRENRKKIKESTLSVEQKRKQDKQLVETARKTDEQVMKLFGLKKPSANKKEGTATNKKIGGTVVTKKKKVTAKKNPQSGHNRLY